MYMANFLSPLQLYNRTPILMHVGSTKSQPVKFIPLLFGFIADTKESNDIVGIKGAPMCLQRCRMCLSTDPMKATYANPALRRLDEQTEMQGRRGQEAWIQKMLGRPLSQGQLHSLRITMERCIQNAFNSTFRFVERDLYDVFLNLSTMTPFDKLHTVLKGVLELCLRWSVAIVIAVSKRDVRYKHSIAILDSRIKSFNSGQSIAPFGSHRFPEGISVLFGNGSNRDANALEQSVGSGGRIEAQRLAILLWQVSLELSFTSCFISVNAMFQFMLCLGTDDNILPNNKHWATEQSKFVGKKKLEGFQGNVLGVVLKGVCTVLEYVKMLSAADFTQEQIKKIQEVGQLASLHTLNIFQLKQALLNAENKMYRGIKLHACINHIHQQILLFGSPSFIDTTRFEHQHAVDGVAAVTQTSGRGKTRTEEMLMTVSSSVYNTCTLRVL